MIKRKKQKQRQKMEQRITRLKSRRYFRSKKIDYSKYIKDFYLDNGIAYISCNVSGIEDIISKYSVEGYEDLNPEFAEYVDQNAYYIPLEYPIVLEICGGNFSEKEQLMISETISDYYKLKLGDAQLDLSRNASRSHKMFILGILSWILYFVFKKSQALQVVFDLIFWFFLWEMGDTAWLERSELHEKKDAAAQMACMRIVFKKKFVDKPESMRFVEDTLAEVFEETV